jgi:uncharacterized Tic20 family protein
MNKATADRRRQQISFKYRSIAALLHAIFAMPMGLNIGFYLWMGFIADRQIDPVSLVVRVMLYFFCVSLPLIIVWPTISWITWVTTKKIHPFVDLAGRDLLNYTLANSIAIILTLITFVVANNSLPSNEYIRKIMLTFLCLVPIAFAINAVIAGIFSFRGQRLSNILIHPFVKD